MTQIYHIHWNAKNHWSLHYTHYSIFRTLLHVLLSKLLNSHVLFSNLSNLRTTPRSIGSAIVVTLIRPSVSSSLKITQIVLFATRLHTSGINLLLRLARSTDPMSFSQKLSTVSHQLRVGGRALMRGCPSNYKLKFVLTCTEWPQCTPSQTDRQMDKRTNTMAIAR